MNLFENLQKIKESKILKERDYLSPNEFNKLKKVLNQNNSMRGNFILHPRADSTHNYYAASKYIYEIKVFGAFKTYEQTRKPYGYRDNADVTYADTAKEGRGVELYSIYINLINQNIKFRDEYDYNIKNYVDRYVRNLVNNNEVTENQIDINSLVEKIKEISKQSQIDIEKYINDSKSFIYNLTKNFKNGKETDYNLDLNESSKLTESFDPSMPNWLKVAIREMNTRNYRYGKSIGQSYSLDTLKWTVEKFPEKGKFDQISPNEIFALLLDESGEDNAGKYIVYCPKLGIGDFATMNVNGRERQISKMSLKALAPYVKEFAHAIDSTQDRDNVYNKRTDRIDSRRNMITRSDETPPYWEKGYRDASGYLVDPNKYKKLLAQNNADKYAKQLEDLYIVLNDTKEKISSFVSNNIPDASAGIYNGSYSKIRTIIDTYRDACGEYQDAIKSLDNVKTGSSATWEGEAYEVFTKHVEICNKIVAKIIELIDENIKS